MLKISGKFIVGQNGKKVFLRGISLGGWLMMEGYVLGGENIPERVFKEKLGTLKDEFSFEFRNLFITQKDAEIIKEIGFNCVRIPFNYRLLEEQNGIELLKTAVSWFTNLKVYVILDMHAVPGSQNNDWHSDSTGTSEFFDKEEHQERFYSLWDKLSKTFKDEEYMAGYDVMNEPVTGKIDILRRSYEKVIQVIRNNNDKHIIFLEGNMWAQQVDFLEGIFSENIALSVHFYEPSKFTFGKVPNLLYPGRIDGVQWDKEYIGKYLKKYLKFGVPVYVGEFGVASRCHNCHEEFEWVRDCLKIFNNFNFHWTYWTYKSVGGMKYPDGLFQLFDQTGIIGSEGEKPGMENILLKLKENKRKVYEMFDTKQFELNKYLLKILKRGFN